MGIGGITIRDTSISVSMNKIFKNGKWPDDVVVPSAIAFRPGGSCLVSKESSVAHTKQIVKDFGAAAKRAVEISGFEFVEIHCAHGYLMNLLMSATSNKRTNEYGGSFKNRIRIVQEVIGSVRENIGTSSRGVSTEYYNVG